MHETYTLHSILNNFFLSPASQIQVTLLISSLFLNIRTVSSQKSIYLNNISFPDNTQDVFIPAYLCRDFKIHNSNLSIPPIFPICQTFVSHFLAYRVGNTESINWTPVVPSSLHFFFFFNSLGPSTQISSVFPCNWTALRFPQRCSDLLLFSTLLSSSLTQR